MLVWWISHACGVDQTCLWGGSDMRVGWIRHACGVDQTCLWGGSDMLVGWIRHACGVDQTCLWGKSTRLNSSHVASSYAVFCLKKRRMAGDTAEPAAPS